MCVLVEGKVCGMLEMLDELGEFLIVMVELVIDVEVEGFEVVVLMCLVVD